MKKSEATLIGKELRKYRVDHFMTAQMMADTLNISIATLTQIELGTRPMSPSLYYKIVANMELSKREEIAILNPIRHACLMSVISKMELPEEVAKEVVKVSEEYLAICLQNYRNK